LSPTPGDPERGLLLAGDVGGTKTNLALFAPAGPAGSRPRLLRSAHYPSPGFPDLAPILAAFLGAAFLGAPGGDAPRVGAACFGVAGPVAGNRSRLPNLDWPELDGAALAQATGIPAGRLRLINDLVATAEAIPLFGPEDLAVLQIGNSASAEGNRVLIAAGTGLGMALLPRIGEAWVPIASEGGHMDFAARDEEEAALVATLRRRHGHVSVERVVSGASLPDIYQHLLESGGEDEVPAVAERLGAAADPAPVITAAALSGESALCARTLDLFVAAYGAAAGNLALAGTATGGVYLGGGIAPKILARLTDGPFLRAFADKGRFREYLEAIPVRVLLDDQAALLGAASVAARLLTSG